MQKEPSPGETPAAEYLEALHGLAAAAEVCEGAAGGVWRVTDNNAVDGPFMLRAAKAVGPSLAGADLKLLQFDEGGSVALHAVEALAILYRHTGCDSAASPSLLAADFCLCVTETCFTVLVCLAGGS